MVHVHSAPTLPLLASPLYIHMKQKLLYSEPNARVECLPTEKKLLQSGSVQKQNSNSHH